MEVSRDFIRFLKEYGVIGLALAVVIGTVAKDLVSAVVDELIMPIVGVLLPGDDWRTAAYMLYDVEFGVGRVIGESLDFIIVAFLLYLFVRYALKKENVEKL